MKNTEITKIINRFNLPASADSLNMGKSLQNDVKIGLSNIHEWQIQHNLPIENLARTGAEILAKSMWEQPSDALHIHLVQPGGHLAVAKRTAQVEGGAHIIFDTTISVASILTSTIHLPFAYPAEPGWAPKDETEQFPVNPTSSNWEEGINHLTELSPDLLPVLAWAITTPDISKITITNDNKAEVASLLSMIVNSLSQDFLPDNKTIRLHHNLVTPHAIESVWDTNQLDSLHDLLNTLLEKEVEQPPDHADFARWKLVAAIVNVLSIPTDLERQITTSFTADSITLDAVQETPFIPPSISETDSVEVSGIAKLAQQSIEKTDNPALLKKAISTLSDPSQANFVRLPSNPAGLRNRLVNIPDDQPVIIVGNLTNPELALAQNNGWDVLGFINPTLLWCLDSLALINANIHAVGGTVNTPREVLRRANWLANKGFDIRLPNFIPPTNPDVVISMFEELTSMTDPARILITGSLIVAETLSERTQNWIDLQQLLNDLRKGDI